MKLPSLGPRARGPLEPKGWDRVQIHTFVLPGHSKVTKGGVDYRIDDKEAPGVKGSRPTNNGPAVQEVEVECVVWTDEQVALLVKITTELRQMIEAENEKQAQARAAREQEIAARDRELAVRRDAQRRLNDAAGLINSTLGLEVTAPRVATTNLPRVSGPVSNQPAVFSFDALAVRHLGITKVMIKSISPLLESTDPRGRRLTISLRQWEPPKPTGGTPDGVAKPPRGGDRSRPPNRVTDDPDANPAPDEVLLREMPSVDRKPKQERKR